MLYDIKKELKNNSIECQLHANCSCFVSFWQQPFIIFFIILLIIYIFLTFYFTVNHVYLEWDEIMFKVVGRKFVGELGGELFNEIVFKAPLFSLLLGIFGSNDFLVVAIPGIFNFLLLSLFLYWSLEGKKNIHNYWLLGLTIFVFSYQVQYYFVVFYAETLSITFILSSIYLFVKRKHPFLLALACFGVFLTRINLGILFIFYPFCYFFLKKDRRFILSFICYSVSLLIIYVFVEFAITDKIAKTFFGMLKKVESTNPWIIENKILSNSFYPLVFFDLLGIFNGIIFYIGTAVVIWKFFTKKMIPEVIKISFFLIIFLVISLIFIATKCDRFIVPILPLIIIVNIWTLSEFSDLFRTNKFFQSVIFKQTFFLIIGLVLILSASGMFSLFKYSHFLSRESYCFSEPRSMGGPRERFFWRNNSENAQLVYQYNIFHYLKWSSSDKIIYTDLWHYYVYANFGHKIVLVRTEDMEKAKMHKNSIVPEKVPKGGFFLGRHEFPNSKIVGYTDSIKGVIIK